MNHTYLRTTPINEAVERIEDGCYADPDARLDSRTVWHVEPPTAFERLAEEARWAARSGPCVVLRPPTVTALPAARTNRRAGRPEHRTGVAA